MIKQDQSPAQGRTNGDRNPKHRPHGGRLLRISGAGILAFYLAASGVNALRGPDYTPEVCVAGQRAQGEEPSEVADRLALSGVIDTNDDGTADAVIGVPGFQTVEDSNEVGRMLESLGLEVGKIAVWCFNSRDLDPNLATSTVRVIDGDSPLNIPTTGVQFPFAELS